MRSKRGAVLAIIGLLLALAGPFAYAALMKSPTMRSTGLPAFALMGAGCVLAIAGARPRRPIWVRVVAGLTLVLTALFVYGFFVFARLPAADRTLASERAADFTLPDHTGRPVSLSETLKSGPVLLVFYRGHW